MHQGHNLMGMDKSELEKFRKLLLDWRDDLQSTSDVREEGSGTVHLDQQSVGRLSRMDAIQGQALALISGGYDSPVAAWRMMRRGVKTHFVFFNLGGASHERGVREVTHHLWQRYSRSHCVKFISVPFEGVVGELMRRVDHSYRGVVLKRMMLRAAEQGENERLLGLQNRLADMGNRPDRRLAMC